MNLEAWLCVIVMVFFVQKILTQPGTFCFVVLTPTCKTRLIKCLLVFAILFLAEMRRMDMYTSGLPKHTLQTALEYALFGMHQH